MSSTLARGKRHLATHSRQLKAWIWKTEGVELDPWSESESEEGEEKEEKTVKPSKPSKK